MLFIYVKSKDCNNDKETLYCGCKRMSSTQWLIKPKIVHLKQNSVLVFFPYGSALLSECPSKELNDEFCIIEPGFPKTFPYITSHIHPKDKLENSLFDLSTNI